MKTLKFFVGMLVLCALMVSCTKEGLYNPKKKISQITYTYSYKSEYWDGNSWVVEDEYNGEDGHQVWNWNGKQLESIDYYYDGQLSYTDHFTYMRRERSPLLSCMTALNVWACMASPTKVAKSPKSPTLHSAGSPRKCVRCLPLCWGSTFLLQKHRAT